MQTLICLVRHGVTDWNYEGRAQGHTDIPLNAEGLRQAAAVAAKLAAEPWDAIYSSTLSRARMTAQAIADRTGHAVQEDARLKERSIGVAEGLTAADRRRLYPNVPWDTLPGFETDDRLATRATEVLTEIARRHAGQRVLCVAHGGLISAFLNSLHTDAGARPFFHSRNTSTVRLVYDGERFIPEGPADFGHLLMDGVEYSGELGRLRVSVLAPLFGPDVAPEAIEAAIAHATAVENAWVGDQLVGFARLFTDGVLAGYVDQVRTLPAYEHVVPTLLERLQTRYPGVKLKRVD